MTEMKSAEKTPATVFDELKKTGILIYAYLNQGGWWKPKGRPPLPVADMDEGWRHNAASWLLRNAVSFELRYALGEVVAMTDPTIEPVIGPKVSRWNLMSDHAHDAWQQEIQRRSNDPAAWIRTTALYRALVAGLSFVESGKVK